MELLIFMISWDLCDLGLERNEITYFYDIDIIYMTGKMYSIRIAIILELNRHRQRHVSKFL
jgi:hypothetical protein